MTYHDHAGPAGSGGRFRSTEGWGGGTPFFPTLDKWITLELVENRTFPSGAVLLRYVAKN
jgi:hypothetical protein